MNMKITCNQWFKRVAAGVLAFAAVPALMAATFTVDGINYKSSGTKVTVQKYTITKASGTTPADTAYYTGNIVIPETVTYDGTTYTVTATAANAFLNCKDLTSVTLPSTCTTIGRNCFSGCSALTTSPIPSTVTSVGTGVLKNCSSITEVTIPAGWNKVISEEFSGMTSLKKIIIDEGSTAVTMKAACFGTNLEAKSTVEEIVMNRNVDASAYTAMADKPFRSMSALKKVTVGGATTTIQSYTFQSCSALETVTFESGVNVTAIESYAFQYCSSLKSIAIPTAVTTISQCAFDGCSSLASATMGDNVTSIDYAAFQNTALTSITLPSALTSIGQYAFHNSKIAGALTIPTGVTSIGAYAFAGTSLTTVSIPAATTSIGECAFAPITTLSGITVDASNTAFKVVDNVLLSMDGTRLLVTAHEAGNFPTNYSNSTVTTIDPYGMAYSKYQTVDLPALTKIGDYGFAFSSIKEFTLASNVTVGVNVFSNSALETLVIEEGRNEIPQGLCANCPELSSVTLPNSTTNMMKDCFANCPKLLSMTIPANVNYMESGSVPSTIQELHVLNANCPVLAANVFNSSQGNVKCYVAPSSVSKFKAAAQWQYLDIIGDESISASGASLGCPTGLYFATDEGKLLYKDPSGNIIDTEFNAGEHAFTLASYKNRIYVADAGKKYTYQAASEAADGQLFYVNNSNGIFYRVTVLNNVGYTPSEDPFTMAIDTAENIIYISDRNVGIHQLDADTVGLYGSQPFLLQNQWLPYYNDEISWGAITGGFLRDSRGTFWMSKKFNGLCLLRFNKSDIYSDGNITGKTKPYNALFKDVIIKTMYLDEVNGYLYMHVYKDAYGAVPGIYRIALSKLINTETGADIAGNADLKIADCELIDNSPILSEGTASSGEVTAVAQITGDGENIYWGYIAPDGDGESAASGSVEYDATNPLHKSGIKTIKAAATTDGSTPTVSYAVENYRVYGITGATYVAPEEPTTITLNADTIVLDNEEQTFQLIATVLPEQQDVVWSTSDASVATVDNTGLVSATNQDSAPKRAPKREDATGEMQTECDITAAVAADTNIKAMCHVIVMHPSAVKDITTAAEAISETYYNAEGMQSTTPFQGLNIVVKTYSDGTVKTVKVVK